MDLRDCRFYQGSYGLNFTVYSDQPCRACFLDRIVLPIDQQAVEIFAVEPGPQTRWVVIQTMADWDARLLRYFVRRGQEFPEVEHDDSLARRYSHEIRRKIPAAAA